MTSIGAGLGQAVEESIGTGRWFRQEQHSVAGQLFGPTFNQAPGKAARDFSQLLNIGFLVFGTGPGRPTPIYGSRISPRGVPYLQPVGTVPRATDFQNAAALLSGDLSLAQKLERLRQLWTQEGIHPAEVADKAQHDPAFLQRVFLREGDAAGPAARAAEPEFPSADVNSGTLHGLPPQLRVIAPVDKNSLPPQPPLHPVKSLEDARQQLRNIDEINALHPNADTSQAEFVRKTAYALGTDDVPIPPKGLWDALNTENGVEDLSKLTPAQLASTRAGISTARDIRAAYLDGEMQVEQTGKLFLWSFLSRATTPFAHESLFIDAFRGVGQWIKKAAAGEFSGAILPAYEEWVKQVAAKGSGQPGAAATLNLLNFGRHFLIKMAERTEEGSTLLQQLHSMMSDPAMTGKDIRRWFVANTTGTGAGNKVVSFALLGGGFDDVIVLDRIMINKLFKNDRLGDSSLYGCCRINGSLIRGSGLERIMNGPMGIYYYEAMERAVASGMRRVFAALGRPGEASVARWHWENWLRSSVRDTAHDTLKLVLRDTEDRPGAAAGVTAREGRYNTFGYGAQYGRDAADQPYIKWTSPLGGEYLFEPKQFGDFTQKIGDPREGIVPKGFKVSEAKDAPWFEQSGVDKQGLDDFAKKWGTPVRVR